MLFLEQSLVDRPCMILFDLFYQSLSSSPNTIKTSTVYCLLYRWDGQAYLIGVSEKSICQKPSEESAKSSPHDFVINVHI